MTVADSLRSAENDLQHLRQQMAAVARFIADPAYDDVARRALAHSLGLPEPSRPKGAAPVSDKTATDPQAVTA